MLNASWGTLSNFENHSSGCCQYKWVQDWIEVSLMSLRKKYSFFEVSKGDTMHLVIKCYVAKKIENLFWHIELSFLNLFLKLINFLARRAAKWAKLSKFADNCQVSLEFKACDSKLQTSTTKGCGQVPNELNCPKLSELLKIWKLFFDMPKLSF